ncbi:MAG: RNA polymerase sigma factor [Saprospiraceae bacterium]|nr:RNA polymerase sigma factor [Lewinella sp.]
MIAKSKSITPEVILQGLKDNDPRIITYYYHDLRDQAYAYICAIFGRDRLDLLEDLFSDAFIKLQEKIQTGRYEHQNLNAFALGIIKNMFLNARKKKAREISYPPEDLSDLIDEAWDPILVSVMEPAEILQPYHLKSWYLQLSTKERLILILRAKDWPHKEIAEYLDLAPGSVRNIFMRLSKQAKELSLKRLAS